MKSRELIVLAMCVLLSISSIAQENENRFGFELSSGLSIATDKLSDAELKPGFGYEGIFHYRFIPHLGLYGGWGWNQFTSENSFAGKNVNFEETGYVFGLQFQDAIGNSAISYYLRGGGLYNHIEIEDVDGELINDSGHGFGWQAAGGIDIKLGSNWSLTPGVKFNSLSRDTDYDSVVRKMKLDYFTLRIGILKSF